MVLLTEDEMRQAVNRFLGWRVPENFGPDGGVKFDRDYAAKYGRPTGTNLLDATQARAMLEYVLDQHRS